jgi:hypothetical protein
MDEKIQKIMQEKIHETMVKVKEITLLINSLKLSSDVNSFGYGVMIGRLYNSFYYQSRRILKRDPTEKEFSDFIELVKQHQSKFLDISFS